MYEKYYFYFNVFFITYYTKKIKEKMRRREEYIIRGYVMRRNKKINMFLHYFKKQGKF